MKIKAYLGKDILHTAVFMDGTPLPAKTFTIIYDIKMGKPMVKIEFVTHAQSFVGGIISVPLEYVEIIWGNYERPTADAPSPTPTPDAQ